MPMRHVILVHQKTKQDIEDYRKIQRRVHERTDDIRVFIADTKDADWPEADVEMVAAQSGDIRPFVRIDAIAKFAGVEVDRMPAAAEGGPHASTVENPPRRQRYKVHESQNRRFPHGTAAQLPGTGLAFPDSPD